MELNSGVIINDSLSERELQSIARMEMSIALDNYVKKKRNHSQVSYSNQCSIAPSESICSNRVEETNYEEARFSLETDSLKEPLRTYNKALSNVLSERMVLPIECE